MNSYLTDFEKLQIIKTDLFNHKKQSQYSENENSFIANDFILKKNKYFYRPHKLNKLIKDLSNLNNSFLSIKKFYLMSRSNAYESEIKDILTKILSTKKKIEALKMNDNLFIMTNTLTSTETTKKEDVKPKMSPSKKQKTKKFLFDSYQQCISRKTSSPHQKC